MNSLQRCNDGGCKNSLWALIGCIILYIRVYITWNFVKGRPFCTSMESVHYWVAIIRAPYLHITFPTYHLLIATSDTFAVSIHTSSCIFSAYLLFVRLFSQPWRLAFCDVREYYFYIRWKRCNNVASFKLMEWWFFVCLVFWYAKFVLWCLQIYVNSLRIYDSIIL